MSGLFSDWDSCIHGSAPTLPFVSCISTQFHNAMLNNFSYINQEYLAYVLFYSRIWTHNHKLDTVFGHRRKDKYVLVVYSILL